MPGFTWMQRFLSRVKEDQEDALGDAGEQPRLERANGYADTQVED